MNRIKIIAIAAAAFAGSAIPAHANPIIPNIYGRSTDGPLFLLIALSSLLLEYLMVRRLFHPWVKFRHVLPSFLLINLVSFPLTTVFSIVIVWFAEILPLALEPNWYKWYFGKIGADVPHLHARIIGANLASFTVGIVAYHLIGAWAGG